MTDWLEAAKALPLGQKKRVPCCKSDTTLLVSHSGRGYHAWCFRCHRSEFQPHGERKISDILRHKAENAIKQQQEIALPEDYTLDVPTAQAVWYMRYGISPELAREYKIGYSETLNRIILPVFENGELAAVQMRACAETQKPKYLNITGGKSAAMFWINAGADTRGVVVTEDILSAIKVGKVIPAVSLLGSNLNDARTLKLNNFDIVILWLDPDEAGQSGQRKAYNKLSMQGVPNIAQVFSEKDPKEHTIKEIEGYLSEALAPIILAEELKRIND